MSTSRDIFYNCYNIISVNNILSWCNYKWKKLTVWHHTLLCFCSLLIRLGITFFCRNCELDVWKPVYIETIEWNLLLFLSLFTSFILGRNANSWGAFRGFGVIASVWNDCRGVRPSTAVSCSSFSNLSFYQVFHHLFMEMALGLDHRRSPVLQKSLSYWIIKAHESLTAVFDRETCLYALVLSSVALLAVPKEKQILGFIWVQCLRVKNSKIEDACTVITEALFCCSSFCLFHSVCVCVCCRPDPGPEDGDSKEGGTAVLNEDVHGVQTLIYLQNEVKPKVKAGTFLNHFYRNFDIHLYSNFESCCYGNCHKELS